MDDVKVSIVCNTYNHEPYIRDALEGFVNQVTNFQYEVLIHDDASTDKTADVIREYEEKYPDLIKPIYQTENQYSQGIDFIALYQYPRARGKYVAFCEGDDYWTDPSKLQKQYDILESHPEIDMCAHRAKNVNGVTGEACGSLGPGEQDRLLTAKEVIRGGGGFVATASLFYRGDLFNNPPSFRNILSLDYTMQILGSLKGGIFYFGDVMSVYRVQVPGSWTACMSKDYKRKIALNKKILKMLLQLNKDTGHKYWFTILTVYIKVLIRDLGYTCLMLKGDLK